MTNKKCPCCANTKSISEFSKSKNRKDGLQGWCRLCNNIAKNKWKALNQEDEVQANKEWYENNKEHKAEVSKKWRIKNKLKVAIKNKKWKAANKEHLLDWHRSYQKRKQQTDINYKLRVILRSRLKKALKNNCKKGSAVRDLGCSIEELKSYLESKFKVGMTWDNWSKDGWHIDHMKPLAKFNLSDPEQLKQACHYTNLQPLWAEDNLKKGKS